MLTPGDIRRLAKAVGLDIVADDKSLGIATTDVHSAMHDWVLGSRIKGQTVRQGPALTWAESLLAWANDGIVLLGGILDTAKDGQVKHGPALIGALALLMRALPLHDTDPETTGRTDSDTQLPLAAALRQTGLMDGGFSDFPAQEGALAAEELAKGAGLTVSYEVMEQMLTRMLGALAVINILSPELIKYVSSLPARSGKDTDLQRLMQRLSYCFQQLHGRRYTVITPNPASHHSAPPSGVALEWTRGLFHLFDGRAEAIPGGSFADKFPEFRELVKWVDQPHAAAELIKPIDYWQRKAAEDPSRADNMRGRGN